MNIATLAMMAAMLGMGTAHAETLTSRRGFDRVGMGPILNHSATGERGTAPARFGEAPGERADGGQGDYAARKRELARRLVWLMLTPR